MQAQNVLRCVPLYIQEWIIEKDINLQHIGADRKMANIFTKALGEDKLQHFSMALDVRPLNISSLREREASRRPKAGQGLT